MHFYMSVPICVSFIPQVILDEPGVKEEPQEIEEEITDTKEIFESHDFEHPGDGDSLSDKGTSSGGGPTVFESQMLASQPQSMEDLVAQAIPGSSGLQGVSHSCHLFRQGVGYL